MALHYKLEIFEGPLDLLLHLIEKAEIDIYNIPIREITDQFIEYLETMRTLDLEPTSEFLVMAATLLSIKSKMLLPKPPQLEDEIEEEGRRGKNSCADCSNIASIKKSPNICASKSWRVVKFILVRPRTVEFCA